MWLFHIHNILKIQPFYPVFPLTESIAKTFCWLSFWNFKEKSINQFLWHSQQKRKRRRRRRRRRRTTRSRSQGSFSPAAAPTALSLMGSPVRAGIRRRGAFVFLMQKFICYFKLLWRYFHWRRECLPTRGIRLFDDFLRLCQSIWLFCFSNILKYTLFLQYFRCWAPWLGDFIGYFFEVPKG